MATSQTKTPAPANDAADAPIDQDALDLKALAKGVLARDFRPRVSSVRRLAEAVLGEPAAPAKAKKSNKKKKASGKKSGKKRLAKIPGQKSGKKKA
ncbi:hypothetical protein [Alteraurantiacibacter aquimixticola]|uniref:Uncharacterized protein n=1 Tax=Alteraurantiacibacter aquimixticola TaxID=2489173 RepID=A0A4T3EY83_9SPHN|nr:hypothetical protein [Alteraurantiacibacter aquimixticola]TIX49609.1 hypothetical protein E5222_12295 [Alteraurantiacibacter aquimixticola]